MVRFGECVQRDEHDAPGVPKIDDVDATLAQLLEAIETEPVPPQIRTLAEKLREALLQREDIRTR